MTENALIRWLRRQEPALAELLGDDAAVLPPLPSPAVTVDSQIAGIHFPEGLDPALLAQRLLAVNLSDLAAMGASPRYGFLTLSVPEGFDHRRFFRAFLKACRIFGVRLAGGDLASCRQVTTSLTLVGELPPGGHWLKRSTGRARHDLWLGGTVGESALGYHLLAAGAQWQGNRISLPKHFEAPTTVARAARRAIRRHLRPSPQLELGRWLGQQGAGGAIDISDGLSLDLHRLCEASGTGAEVFTQQLPTAPKFEELCRQLDQPPLDLALSGGEDYVLLFSLPTGTTPPNEFGCYPIGRLTQTGDLLAVTSETTQPLRAVGWDHLARPSH
ncbi:MAG: thiamine-phosphate kinase [Deltaproteobacteria bacterium]|nr:thiamine-phosphate kinase [Deltaproteobacteria bacterium]